MYINEFIMNRRDNGEKDFTKIMWLYVLCGNVCCSSFSSYNVCVESISAESSCIIA